MTFISRHLRGVWRLLATWLATNYGLQYVGYYLCAAAAISLIGLALTPETRDADLATG